MINITNRSVKGTKYWVADFRSAPVGFTPEEWRIKTDQLIASGIIPKSKQLMLLFKKTLIGYS